MHKCDLCNNLSEHREPGFQPNKVCKLAGNDLAGALRACSAKECPYGGPFYGVRNNNDRWISVKDRLPDEGDIYLVVVKEKHDYESQWNYHVDAASNYGDYIDDYWDTFNDWNEGNEVHVTHWMPLPEPPKEEA